MAVNLHGIKVNQMKAEILKTLRETKGYISGEKLGQSLGTSRVSYGAMLKNVKEQDYALSAAP